MLFVTCIICGDGVPIVRSEVEPHVADGTCETCGAVNTVSISKKWLEEKLKNVVQGKMYNTVYRRPLGAADPTRPTEQE